MKAYSLIVWRTRGSVFVFFSSSQKNSIRRLALLTKMFQSKSFFVANNWSGIFIYPYLLSAFQSMFKTWNYEGVKCLLNWTLKLRSHSKTTRKCEKRDMFLSTTTAFLELVFVTRLERIIASVSALLLEYLEFQINSPGIAF